MAKPLYRREVSFISRWRQMAGKCCEKVECVKYESKRCKEWKGRPFLIAKCVEALQQSVVECNYRKVKKLLGICVFVSGVDFGVEDIPGLKPDDYPQTSFETPLMTALNNADIKMVRLLLSKGANPNSVSSYGEYPIFIALR
jgi:hypothetical protein